MVIDIKKILIILTILNTFSSKVIKPKLGIEKIDAISIKTQKNLKNVFNENNFHSFFLSVRNSWSIIIY
ncbi:hypothetical protein NW739_06430 [Mycoplasmopsis felis]|uniref:hypothetical protein n=1 Tax=Mycoplasmopsis felis TaxID=33923 RepID=UPI0021AF39BF|nr:hypothetical protein [Mycoplasmopsis felis]MCU9940282.1 hypothetical protein [Mycoplasmopsis felis]UWV83770.1 hypothetical protein NWE58_05740 [Mycoplasmopsis felis]UWV85472.1 hypothetical protein NW066_02090 [Mycoplasmopsis felis]WAM02305.1 hypothetical protein ONA02_00125 [Mycoplasmopsis felis]